MKSQYYNPQTYSFPILSSRVKLIYLRFYYYYFCF
jgi:hypothetical protein